MGNNLCKKRREMDLGDADAGNTLAVVPGEKPPAEDVLYATIDHKNGEAKEKHVEMHDDCDYAMINIPSEISHKCPVVQDSADDYVLMS